MSAQVLDIASPERVEAAWEQYQALAVQVGDDPHLISDRDFNQRMAVAHEKWRRLYLRTGAAA